MTFLPIIGAIGGVLGLLALLAAAFVVVRSSATKAAAEAWRGEAEAQKARGDRLEAALEDLRGRVALLEADNKRLADLATGASALRALTDLVKTQHQELTYLIGTMTTAPTRRPGGAQ